MSYLELPCTIHMLVADSAKSVSIKHSAVPVTYTHRSSYTLQAVKQTATVLSITNVPMCQCALDLIVQQIRLASPSSIWQHCRARLVQQEML